MALPQDGCLLRVFVGEGERCDGRPLYEWIVRQARATGLAGATAVRAMMGYGAGSLEIHTFRIERLSEDLPVVIEIVDTRERIEAFLALIEPHIGGGLATLEEVEVHLYRADGAGKRGTA